MKQLPYYIVGILLLLLIEVNAQSIQQISSIPSQGGGYSQTPTYKHDCVVGGVFSGIISNVPYTGSSIGFLYTNQNLAPTANSGADQIVVENNTVSLTGIASTDPEGSSLTYTWTSLDGVSLNNSNIVNPTFTAPSQLAQRKYRFQLQVSDGLNVSNLDTVIIIIRDINWQPVVYPTSCSLVGLCSFSGVYADVSDVVGTFSATNNECRGVQEVVFVGGLPYALFNIQTFTTEQVYFVLYDFSQNKTCNVPGTFTVIPQGTLGTPPNPFLLDAQCFVLSTNAISGNTFCAGVSVNVPFTASNPATNGNVFTAQLSNSVGSFANPITIGTLTGTGSGTISAQIPVNTLSGNAYRIRVAASNPPGTGTDNGTNITINSPNFTPTITANQTTVCVGGTSTFTNTVAGTTTPYTRQWQISTNNITFSNITNATSSAYTATLNTAGTYYYRLAVIKSGQCTGYSNMKSVTVVPDPAVTITGNAAFCGSGSTIFTANPQYGAGNCSLQWQQYLSNTWVSIPNGIDTTYTTSNSTISRNYRLRLNCSGSGCGIAYSNISTLTINPLPNVATNAPTAILCEGGQRGITATGANTYTWTPTAGLSATTGAIVTAAPLVSTTYIVTGTNTTTGCVKSANAVFTVVTDPIVTINGATSMCLGASTNLTSVISGGTGAFIYQWQSSTNGSAWISIGGASLATYNLAPTATGIKYYRLKITCTGIGCTAITYSNVLQISTNAMPTIALAGTSPICVGGTANMIATTTGGIGTATYVWQRSTDGGQTWTTLNGANTPIYSPTNIQVNTSYKVTVSYTGIGCGSVTSNVFNILVNPDPTISITGTTALCGAGSTTFSATTTGGAGTCGVQWQEYLNGGWVNISGGTGNNFITPTLTATKQYRAFVACSESGCGTAYSNTGILTINTVPNVTTNAPTTVGCEGITKTITASGANTYTWSPSAGLNTATGATVIATPTVSTTYTVTGTNTTTGCSNTATAIITVIPDPIVSISGPGSVTSGATAALTSTVTGGTGTCVYQWQTSTNGTSWSNISGATNNTYTTPALTTAKYYRLTLTCNGTACNAATSNVLFISIVAIKQTDIKGDNSLTTIPESVVLAVENAELINIFPNPTQDLLNVELTNLEQGADISLHLFDATGKLVETYKVVAISDSYTTQLNLRKLAIGLYSLEVRIDDTVNTYKVAKE